MASCGLPRRNQRTAIQFIDHVFGKLSFSVECIQTDNCAEVEGASHWDVLDRGIGHVYIKPKTPRLNASNEFLPRLDTF